MSSRTDPVFIRDKMTAAHDRASLIRLEIASLKVMKEFVDPDSVTRIDDRIQVLEALVEAEKRTIANLEERLRLVERIRHLTSIRRW